MDFVALLLFLVMQYVRPQEWSSIVTAMKPVQVLAVIAVLAIMHRKQSVRRQDLWSAPQDYIVTAYFAWTIFASPTPKDTFSTIFPLIFFYFIAVLTLNSLHRIKVFLSVWAASIVFVAALAIASVHGFDPLDSATLTNGAMKGRLVLRLSIFNNPNALAHSLVPAIPMLYYLLFWKRIFAKPLLAVIIIPITAMFMTQSKGAFLSGLITAFATLTFGRPKKVQITMAVFAFMFGGTILYTLPRMNELNTTKTDKAIQGRVAAFEFGLKQMNALTYGHGFGNFESNFLRHGPLRKERRAVMGRVNNRAQLVVRDVWVHYGKSAHSAYVQNGADLGFTGFSIFICIMYCCLRTLVQARTINDEEELIRRTLFAVVVWYAVSAWMVDFCYRSFFFFFAAATSAFHRHLRGQFHARPAPKAEDDTPPLPPPSWTPEPATVVAGNGGGPVTIDVAPVSVENIAPPTAASTDSAPTPAAHGTITWQRFGLIDLAITYLLVRLAIRLWHYAIQTI